MSPLSSSYLLTGSWSLWSLLSQQKEEPSREQGARYSAETGRLIPASAQALNRHGSQQDQRSHLSSRDRRVHTSVLQNQELLVSPTLGAETVEVPVPRLPLFQTALGHGPSWEGPLQQLSGKPPPWESAAWAPGLSASGGPCPVLCKSFPLLGLGSMMHPNWAQAHVPPEGALGCS